MGYNHQPINRTTNLILYSNSSRAVYMMLTSLLKLFLIRNPLLKMLVFLFLKFRQKYVYLAELKGLNNFAVHGICRRMRDHIVIGGKKKRSQISSSYFYITTCHKYTLNILHLSGIVTFNM